MIHVRVLDCLDGMLARDRLAILRRTCRHDPYEFYRLDTPESEPKPEHLGLAIMAMRDREPETQVPPATYLVPADVAADLAALDPAHVRLGERSVLGI